MYPNYRPRISVLLLCLLFVEAMIATRAHAQLTSGVSASSGKTGASSGRRLTSGAGFKTWRTGRTAFLPPSLRDKSSRAWHAPELRLSQGWQRQWMEKARAEKRPYDFAAGSLASRQPRVTTAAKQRAKRTDSPRRSGSRPPLNASAAPPKSSPKK
jgi:hypothetical protein